MTMAVGVDMADQELQWMARTGTRFIVIIRLFHEHTLAMTYIINSQRARVERLFYQILNLIVAQFLSLIHCHIFEQRVCFTEKPTALKQLEIPFSYKAMQNARLCTGQSIL